MWRTAVLVEAAGAKALRIGGVHHGVRRDVPGDVSPALEAGLGVMQVLRVEIEIISETTGGGRTLVEAEETTRDAAHRGIRETEVARAGGQGQYLRDDVEIHRREKRRLFGFAQRVLIKRGRGALNAGIRDGGARRRSDVRKAAGIASGTRRIVRRTRRNGFVLPARLV